MKCFRWEKGRQGTGYERFTLFYCHVPFAMDMHILRARTGVHVPPHRDPATGWKHYRLNIILRKAEGGEFQCKNTIFETKRIKLFRADREEHSVTPVTKGTRYVLSFGCLISDPFEVPHHDH